MRFFLIKPQILYLAIIFTVLTLLGCKLKSGFESYGEFSVKSLPNGCKEITDGFGRRHLLVPKGEVPGKEYRGGAADIIKTPVSRIVAYSDCDISLIRALNVLGQTLVGVTKERDDWSAEDIRKALDAGRIVYLGQSASIDFELLKAVSPDVVFTWDESVIPILDNLDIQTVITTTHIAKGFETYMRFIKFLAPFFNKDELADLYVDRVSTAFDEIKAKTAEVKRKPRAIWGDIYSKRVLVEPGNSWVAHLINHAGGEYVFDDVYGADCLEITLEKFFSGGQTTDILFTYRSVRQGIDTKQELINENPMMTKIKPFIDGAVYSPLPHYRESADRLDEIIKEVAAILHPELFKGYKLKYFMKLP